MCWGNRRTRRLGLLPMIEAKQRWERAACTLSVEISAAHVTALVATRVSALSRRESPGQSWRDDCVDDCAGLSEDSVTPPPTPAGHVLRTSSDGSVLLPSTPRRECPHGCAKRDLQWIHNAHPAALPREMPRLLAQGASQDAGSRDAQHCASPTAARYFAKYACFIGKAITMNLSLSLCISFKAVSSITGLESMAVFPASMPAPTIL